MPLITVQDVDYSVGGPLLLERVTLSIERGERVCLVGRNGAGKSTLLRLIAGEIEPDDGRVVREDGVKLARMAQEVPQDIAGSVFDVVAAGAGGLGALLAEYHQLSHDGGDSARLQVVHDAIDQAQGWTLEARVRHTLQRLELPEDAAFATLSGGMKRRVLLGRALVDGPDLLLLDEPTNHLDIPSIEWLQQFLLDFSGAIVFITHDRAFLQALATRIVEIDRGRLTSWPGDYANYLRRREERWHAEAQANALFDRRLAEEEVWIRQGIKARRTRNEGRVRALEAMRRERAERREKAGKVKLEAAVAGASGKRVIEVRDAAFEIAPGRVLGPFSTTILRGDRVGIIGANGAGKTTLLRLLLGELTPTRGSIERGTGLELAYFDQHRASLREDWTALDNVAEGQEYIEINGRRKHALGYLQDFLFTPERARAPIARLSGGERNRLLLAKLFARPSNLLVLDEPTNDLDIETLELLEEQLGDYPGTLLLVSHDRAFLDAVVTSTLAIEDDGAVREYVGGYSDWERQRPRRRSAIAPQPQSQAAAQPPAAVTPASASDRRKLSYKDQRELDALPARIESLEAEIAALSAAMQDPAYYRQTAEQITLGNARLAELQRTLDAAYARWESLEGA